MMTLVKAGPGPGTFDSRSALLVAGIGCGSAAEGAEIIALVRNCLEQLQVPPSALVALASHVRKHGHPGLVAAAQHFGLPLVLLDDAQLATDIGSPSARAYAAIGLPSVAEAVAGAAGHILLAKQKSAHATCAISLCAPGFDALAFGQAGRSSAVIAASTLSTSRAGP